MVESQVNSLFNDVLFLTSLDPPRNWENEKSLHEAGEYIKREFEMAGGQSSEQLWIANGRKFRNIITSYNPDKPARLIVGAHYDVCGNQPGADDNASAVAGLLECARLTFSNRPDLEYGVDFVAFSLEEPPFSYTKSMGSYVHALSLHESKADVIGMICLEMIGYFSDRPGSQSYPIPELAALYPETANYIAVVGIQQHSGFSRQIAKCMKEGCQMDVQSIDFPTQQGLAGLSDHWSYWQFGYPAVMITDTAFLRNPNYHQRTDTIDTLNFEKMADVVDGCWNAICNQAKIIGIVKKDY
jgi:Zn-dependent M28 family amino/carboxypeptidase